MNPLLVSDEVIRLYKYLPFGAGTLKVVTDGTIKFANPSDFDDPFDCVPDYSSRFLEEYPNKRPDVFKDLIDASLSPAARIVQKKRLINRLKAKDRSKPLLEELRENWGVLCLSSNPKSILMWSHYADGHRGFMLEFTIPLVGKNAVDFTRQSPQLAVAAQNLFSIPVKYEESRPMMMSEDIDTDATALKALLVKSKEWRYEGEWRCLDHQRGPGIHSYNRNLVLNRIVAGIRIDHADFQALEEAVVALQETDMPHLKLVRAFNKSGTFTVDFTGS